MHNYIIVTTSTGFIVPLCKKQIIIPIFYKTLISLQSIISILFWQNPIKGCLIHRIDSVLARTNISSIIFYKFFIYQNNLIPFSLNTCIMFYCFYKSNYFSKISWLSKPHLIYHSLAHIFASISICIGFYTNKL